MPAPAPAPPWRVVIGNTCRLWWERHVLLPGMAGQTQRRNILRIIVSLLVLALVAVSVTAVELYQHHASAPAAATRAYRSAADTAAIRAATQIRQEAAAWVAGQVGHDVIVACDPLMCAALQQHGFPAANLTPVSPGTGDPLGTGVVVSTAAVRNTLGSRLTDVYAPYSLAAFGSGQSLVQVLVSAPDGAAAYRSAALADMHDREVAGRQLLRNKNVHVSGVAAEHLANGDVDARLLITLAALARYPVQIVSFAGTSPAASAGIPLRDMAILAPSPLYLHGMLSFLSAQRAPLLARTSVTNAGKATILHVEFPAPSPTGLLAKT